MRILRWIQRLFECSHNNTAWPRKSMESKVTHVRCLDCGTAVPYTKINFGKEV